MAEAFPPLVRRIAGLIRLEQGVLILDADPAELVAGVPGKERERVATGLVDLALLLVRQGGKPARPAVDKICMLVIMVLGEVEKAFALFSSRGLTNTHQRVTGSTWSNRPVEKNTPAPGAVKSGPGLAHTLNAPSRK